LIFVYINEIFFKRLELLLFFLGGLGRLRGLGRLGGLGGLRRIFRCLFFGDCSLILR